MVKTRVKQGENGKNVIPGFNFFLENEIFWKKIPILFSLIIGRCGFMNYELFLHKITILKYLRGKENLMYDDIGYILNTIPSVLILYDQKLKKEHIEMLLSKCRG